jgi:glycosyltransferase involved in cell wall biosynthesis
MNVSVIVSVYKDVEALDLIISSLLNQSVEVSEIIISEDGNSEEMRTYFHTLNNPKIKHLFQEDNGWQKNKALNRAIKASTNDYLIFIDGDCVPYDNFVEWHQKLAEPNTVLCGRRTEPGTLISNKLKTRELTLKEFRQNYLSMFFEFKKEKEAKHYDAGIFIDPNSFFGKYLKSKRDKKAHLVGCNFSCFKADLEKINGFDEDFTLPTTGEDTDIERRMKLCNIEMKSCRNAAIIAHLYHKKNFNEEITKQTEALMASKPNRPICKNGMTKYE